MGVYDTKKNKTFFTPWPKSEEEQLLKRNYTEGSLSRGNESFYCHYYVGKN